MLKDRRLLIEQDIEKTFREAGALYLQLVVSAGYGMVANSAEYQALKEKLINLKMELKLVDKLIEDGHP
jgi:hypothetical protein